MRHYDLLIFPKIIGLCDIVGTALSYRKAAKQGHAKAQYRLGLSYMLMKDKDQAVYWYSKAAGQGHVGAQKQLDEIIK